MGTLTWMQIAMSCPPLILHDPRTVFPSRLSCFEPRLNIDCGSSYYKVHVTMCPKYFRGAAPRRIPI